MVSSGTTGRQASVTSINGSSGPEVFTQTDFATAPIGKQGPDAVDMLSGAAAAAAATEAEKLMSLREAVRTYPKAIGWSILLSSAIIMEGFDQVLTPTFFALDQFKRFYGELQPNGTYEVPAPWQAGLTNGGQVGSMIGLLVNGYASERFGYRKTMIGAMIWMACTIFLFFFAHDIQMLQAGMVLAGIPWGVFQTLSTTYAAEVCPTQLRSYLTTYVNLCWYVCLHKPPHTS
jgi:SP family general alpha glucoside:H+ symporter-like MFS transporter